MKIDFIKCSKSAITPTKETEDWTGFDFYLVEEVTSPSSSIKIIKTYWF